MPVLESSMQMLVRAKPQVLSQSNSRDIQIAPALCNFWSQPQLWGSNLTIFYMLFTKFTAAVIQEAASNPPGRPQSRNPGELAHDLAPRDSLILVLLEADELSMSSTRVLP